MRSGIKIIFIFLIVIFPIRGFTQDNGNFINGVLLDAQSREPVVFATIRVVGKSLGVISNNDGSFQVPIEFQFKGEKLEVSSMGYQSMTIAFSDLKKGIVNQILLKPATVELAETIVEGRKKRKPTAKQIIRYALKRIPENYDNNPFDLIGYYRDYQLKENRYINLNEALVKVFDRGFRNENYQSTQFALYEYVKNNDFEIDSFAAKPYDYSNWDKFIPNAQLGSTYAANELVLLFIHDAIRNSSIDAYSYVHTMLEDFVKQHRFSKVKNTFYGDQKVFRIDLAKTEVPFQVKGTIYIDWGSFAIRRLDYSVYQQKPDDSSPTRYSAFEKDLLYEILVEYQKNNERMYLNYISFHNQFKLVRLPKFFIKEVALVLPPSEMRDVMKRKIKVSLNTSPSNWPKDVLVTYQGQQLKVDDTFQEDSLSFSLEFAEKTEKQRKLVNLLFSATQDEKKTSLEIKVPQLTDNEGNLLGERKSEVMDQFREFFTQQVVKESDEEIGPAQLIRKTQSLGNSTQPIMVLDSNQDFWMNTPLKSKE